MILLENLLLDIWSPDVLDLESRQFGKGFLKLSVSFCCISEKKKKTRIILRLSCVRACVCVRGVGACACGDQRLTADIFFKIFSVFYTGTGSFP